HRRQCDHAGGLPGVPVLPLEKGRVASTLNPGQAGLSPSAERSAVALRILGPLEALEDVERHRVACGGGRACGAIRALPAAAKEQQRCLRIVGDCLQFIEECRIPAAGRIRRAFAKFRPSVASIRQATCSKCSPTHYRAAADRRPAPCWCAAGTKAACSPRVSASRLWHSFCFSFFCAKRRVIASNPLVKLR